MMVGSKVQIGCSDVRYLVLDTFHDRDHYMLVCAPILDARDARQIMVFDTTIEEVFLVRAVEPGFAR